MDGLERIVGVHPGGTAAIAETLPRKKECLYEVYKEETGCTAGSHYVGKHNASSGVCGGRNTDSLLRRLRR